MSPMGHLRRFSRFDLVSALLLDSRSDRGHRIYPRCACARSTAKSTRASRNHKYSMAWSNSARRLLSSRRSISAPLCGKQRRNGPKSSNSRDRKRTSSGASRTRHQIFASADHEDHGARQQMIRPKSRNGLRTTLLAVACHFRFARGTKRRDVPEGDKVHRTKGGNCLPSRREKHNVNPLHKPFRL
jgi:hypothetical protein